MGDLAEGWDEERKLVAQNRQEKTDALKSLRVIINQTRANAMYVLALFPQDTPGHQEMVFSITHLIEARMWAGEALGAIGHKLPVEYRDDGTSGVASTEK